LEFILPLLISSTLSLRDDNPVFIRARRSPSISVLRELISSQKRLIQRRNKAIALPKKWYYLSILSRKMSGNRIITISLQREAAVSSQLNIKVRCDMMIRPKVTTSTVKLEQ
jgi:hypothetical protein